MNSENKDSSKSKRRDHYQQQILKKEEAATRLENFGNCFLTVMIILISMAYVYIVYKALRFIIFDLFPLSRYY